MQNSVTKAGFAALAVVTLSAGSVLAQDCKPAHEIDQLVNPGQLTVAIYEYPPFSLTAGGQVGGVDGEIVRAIAEAECLELTPIVVDAAATVQNVISGRADVAIGDWYRTSERAEVLGLSYPLYLDQMAIYSKEGYSKIEDLVGKQAGTVSGFLWVTDLQKLLGANLRLYPSPVALAQDLTAGRIEIAADGYATGVYAKEKGGYEGIVINAAEPDERVRASMQAAQSAILYTKGNESLGRAIDENIKAMHEDGRIADILSSFGLDPSVGDVGEPRLVQ